MSDPLLLIWPMLAAIGVVACLAPFRRPVTGLIGCAGGALAFVVVSRWLAAPAPELGADDGYFWSALTVAYALTASGLAMMARRVDRS